jgi:hypothetical protein
MLDRWADKIQWADAVTITGNVDDGFTAAEIETLSGDMIRVFELATGWYVELPNPELLRQKEVVDAIQAAKAELLHYVNRKGWEFPEGTSRAAMSLWLMQRDDGKGFTVSETL